MLILQTFSRKIFETLSFKNCKVLYQYNSILKRSMINSRCVYTMKTAFACIKTISNNPDIVAKLRYLQINGIPISNLFNEILTHYTRHGS